MTQCQLPKAILSVEFDICCYDFPHNEIPQNPSPLVFFNSNTSLSNHNFFAFPTLAITIIFPFALKEICSSFLNLLHFKPE